MIELESLLIIAVAAPILGTVFTAVLGPRLLCGRSHIPVVVGVAVAFLASLFLAWGLWAELAKQSELGTPEFTLEPEAGTPSVGRTIGFERVVTLWTWADIPQAYEAPSLPTEGQPINRSFLVPITLRIDPLTVFMLVTVTSVSLMVVIYSIGYMAGDPGYWRFFAYLGLFVFSMMMLVSVSNFLLLYVFWEAVGLCSYLLIGFWYQRPPAAAAAKKAFLVNRVGDFGFALAIFLLWTAYGTLNMHDSGPIPGILGQERLIAGWGSFASGALGVAIPLLLFLGACGKSAQFPLHVWLPDAMEGPTPVSALIHAATMVTAGVYLVARCAPIFQISPEAQVTVCTIGTVTALLGAVIALTQTDLKRILAYSTISQLGYMFAAVGLGSTAAVAAGMFHLFTHAFFKALLFLAAGSVMHALAGEIDLRNFGGLCRRLPWTYAMFLVGALALAGIPPLAGFWSKDTILHEVLEAQHALPFTGFVFWTLLTVAALTAFYIFRAFFWAFHGPERLPGSETGKVHHPHESPPVMLVPMLLLAVGAVVAGFVCFLPGGLEGLLAETPSLAAYLGTETVRIEGSHIETAIDPKHIPIYGTVAGLVGILSAAILYLPKGRPLCQRLAWITARLGLYTVSYRKFFIDEVYEWLVVRPLRRLASLCLRIDQKGIDLGLVDGCAKAVATTGRMVLTTQHGAIPGYALAMLMVVLVLLGLWLL
jgi:NADH-quinone oxidoreductase subunit L